MLICTSGLMQTTEMGPTLGWRANPSADLTASQQQTDTVSVRWDIKLNHCQMGGTWQAFPRPQKAPAKLPC